MTPWSRTAAVDLQYLEDPYAVAAGTVCVGSVYATAATSERCGGSCVSVMTSTACDTKENYAQAMECVTAVSASVHQTGRVRTVTAPDARTHACPTWVSSAAAGDSAFVGSVSVPSPGPTGPHVTSAPPAQTHVP